MKTFIINLKRSTDRRDRMKKILKNFPYNYEFFEAIDGMEIKNLSEVYSEKLTELLYGKGLTRGEVGCALSHLGIYKKMLDENITKALILEDDIILQKDFYTVLESLKNFNLNNDIILLGQSGRNRRKKILGNKIDKTHKLHCIVDFGWGAYAYIIDIKAAKKILSLNYPVKMPADYWDYFLHYINISVVEPNIVYPIRGEENSTIDTVENRWENDVGVFTKFIEEIKAEPTIFNFLAIVVCKICFLFKIMRRVICGFFRMFLPEKRLE